MSMSLRGSLLVVLTALIVVCGNVLLRMGLERSGVVPFSRGVSGLPMDVFGLMIEPVFLIAVLFYGVSMLLWLRLVATEPLSLAYPMLAAVTFLTLTVVSVIFLHEPMSVRKAAGIGSLLLGFFLLSGA